MRRAYISPILAALALLETEPGREIARRIDAGETMPEPDQPYCDVRRVRYRDTKPAGPTNEQRRAKRKAQRVSRRKNRK